MDAAYAAAVVGLNTEELLEKIRENIGLQNAGLLVLDSANGSVKRDAWTSNFRDIVFALNFPTAVVVPPVVTPPEQKPEGSVQIPDSNLRAAIAEALVMSPNATIAVRDMEQLVRLVAVHSEIEDLTGLEFATNLNHLNLSVNPVSDLVPLAGLIKLKYLRFGRSNSAPANSVKVSDLSPIAGLINLEKLHIDTTNVSDLSPISGLINLRWLHFDVSNVSDLSPLRGLINLEGCCTWGSPVADLSPLAGLTKLEEVVSCGGDVSDLTPLVGLPNLKRLDLRGNNISDISPLADLTNLTWIDLSWNDVSDISPLAVLTNLTWLNLSNNEISNFSPLDGLRENIELTWFGNPAFSKGGPKIKGPWLWVVLPDTELKSDTDLLSEASRGKVTEVEIATHGATEGKSVGIDVWTSHTLPSTGNNNLEDMMRRSVRNSVIYGALSLYSPREQETTMYVGNDNGLKVWLNGNLVYEELRDIGPGNDYQDLFSITLQHGRNILLVAVRNLNGDNSGFFGFEPGTEYTVTNPGIGYTFSPTPIHVGDIFTLDISAKDVFDLAGWQFDITFDPAALEAINVSEGDFLKTDSVNTLFQSGSIDNAAGKIGGLSAIRLSTQGVTGTGTVLQVTFKAKSPGETELALQNFEFADITGQHIPAGPQQISITVEEQLATGDVNRDGRVSILDLVLIAQQLTNRVPANSPVDLNGDGVVSILDLVLAIREMDNTTSLAPSAVEEVEAKEIHPAMIEAWIAQARSEDNGSLVFKQGIEFLENLLASLIPKETALLHNYPNPFNPETWIPYQLAESAEVTLTIYDMNGEMVRYLALGHQAAGMYQSRSRAVYWDGRNQLGEPVASGLYFYTLTAGEFSATRRMLILK